AVEHAEPRARRVDEGAVESAVVELPDVRVHDVHVRQPLREEPGASGVDLDGRHLSLQERGLVAGRGARVEDAVAGLRADRFCGQPGRAAHAAVLLGRRGLVLRALERERLLAAEVANPHLVDPIRVRLLEGSLGKRGDEVPKPLGETPADRVRESRRTLESGFANELDGVVCDGVRRRLAPRELEPRDPQRSPDGRVELAKRAAAERLDAVVDRTHALHGAVGDPLRERAVARIEVGGRGRERAVGVCVVFEHAPHDVERDAARGRDQVRTPRRNSSYVIRFRPSGCTSTGVNSPWSRRARQTITRRPSTIVHAPMCGESARTRRHASTGSSRRSSRSDGPIFSAYVIPSSGCSVNSGSGRTSQRSRAATSAARAKTAPASSSAAIGNDSCAAIGPASSASTVRWIVTPVTSSPARIARSTGAAPRHRGSSNGCTFNHSAWASSEGGMYSPYAHTTTTSTGSGSSGRDGWCTAIPSRSAASFAGGGASLRPRPLCASGRVTRYATGSSCERRSRTSAPIGAVAATASFTIRRTSAAAGGARAPACDCPGRCGRS